MLYPLARKKPNARYIGEVYKAAVDQGGPRGARAAEHPLRLPGRHGERLLHACEHLTFTFLSDFTYNRVGYVDVDIDDLDALGLGRGDHA